MQQISDGALSEPEKHRILIDIISPPALLPCLLTVCAQPIECDRCKMCIDEVANIIVAHEGGEVVETIILEVSEARKVKRKSAVHVSRERWA